MTTPTVIFSHGHESSPQSRKIQVLRPIAEQAGFTAEAIDYTDLRDEPVARRDRLIGRIDEIDRPVVLAGSSLGGWVSMAAAEQTPVAGLWLMAPALFMEDRVDGGEIPDAYAPRTGHIMVVHGWHDDIIPWHNSLKFAEASGATLHLLADGHRLENSLISMERLFAEFLERVRDELN
ncbi:MAG: YqiA/YcfP family alpha/beta fold hydrolase [Wenzhouxiangellaceae bacterium]